MSKRTMSCIKKDDLNGVINFLNEVINKYENNYDLKKKQSDKIELSIGKEANKEKGLYYNVRSDNRKYSKF